MDRANQQAERVSVVSNNLESISRQPSSDARQRSVTGHKLYKIVIILNLGAALFRHFQRHEKRDDKKILSLRRKRLRRFFRPFEEFFYSN